MKPGIPSREEFEESIAMLTEYCESLESLFSPCEAEVKGGVVIARKCDDKPLLVVGDIHGDYESFHYIKSLAERVGMRGGLVVFLGDYIDRGEPEEQVLVVKGLSELSSRIAGNLVLLRGNHEPPRGLEPYPHDYPWALTRVYGEEAGLELYEDSRRLFDKLHHALLLEGRALMVHGGPPTEGIGAMGVLEYLAWSREGDNFVEILWNDPYEMDLDRLPNPRGVGSLWGRPVTSRVLEFLGVQAIIRAHEPVNGIRFNHHKKVVTVFSRRGPPYSNEVRGLVRCDSVGQLAEELDRCIMTF